MSISKYYNAENKEWFFDECTKTNFTGLLDIKNTIADAKDYEEYLGKDLCNWNISNILSFYKKKSTSSISVLIKNNNIYSRYTQFCLENNLVSDHQNHFDDITPSMLNSCINKNELQQCIVTRQELLEKMSVLENGYEKFIMLAIFEGLYGKNMCELIQAKVSDIHGNVMDLATGRSVCVSNELISYAKESDSQDTFSTRTGKVFKFRETGRIIKAKPNSQKDVNNFAINRTFVNCREAMGFPEKMTAKKLQQSGRIEFIKQEMKKYNVTYDTYLRDPEMMIGMEMQYGPISNVTYFILKYGEYLK